jgi:glutamate synthase (ferredoxin)
LRQRELRQGLYWPEFEHDACGIGMICQIKGRPSHQMVDDAIHILESLKHRGGVGADPLSGDGAGILTQLPVAFFTKIAQESGFGLPTGNHAFGVAMLFVSPESAEAKASVARFKTCADDLGLEVLGSRAVTCDRDFVGPTAAEALPQIFQVFLKRPQELSTEQFEQRLYRLSKLAAHRIREGQDSDLGADDFFYVCSCSCKTIVYKGMLLPEQVQNFYLDLQDPAYQTAIALVHSRFSTNTAPSWERAQPMRQIIHNGEINTIKGNVNWQNAREARAALLDHDPELAALRPLIDPQGSDSAMLDDFVAFLANHGYSLPEAMLVTIPPAWENNPELADDVRAMHCYLSCLTEPWDGPASVSFSDGRFAGAQLDRNGLRPSRYYVTDDDQLVLSSEVGVLPIDPAKVVRKGRLLPGKMLLVDTAEGRIIADDELKHAFAARRPYQRWVEGMRSLEELCPKAQEQTENLAMQPDEVRYKQKLFGYNWEDISLTLQALGADGADPTAAMGYDAPLAMLSSRPQLLYNYFKQMFAQVTNPPIDSIRERLVTSTEVYLNSHGDLLHPDAANAELVTLPTPILSAVDMNRLERLDGSQNGYHSRRLAMLFKSEDSLEDGLKALFQAADQAIAEGVQIIILSDREANAANLPIPALLACAGLHHHLIARGSRTACSLVVESGEPREVHHFCCLLGYGANAVYPYLAYASLSEISGATAEKYQGAVSDGIVKVMAKMGISTIRSYLGAQIFEAIGLDHTLVDRYFCGTVTPVGGIGLDKIESDVRARLHADDGPASALPPGGEYRLRAGAEAHLVSPQLIYYLQQACRSGDYRLYQKACAYGDPAPNADGETQAFRLRDLLAIKGVDGALDSGQAIPLDQVESVDQIVTRFKTGAMSFGSISKEAHECMAVAMNHLHAKSNSGEGGEDPLRYQPVSKAEAAAPEYADHGIVAGDDRSSAIKQVASGRFGVTIDYLGHAREIQIKMAQGAKPGEGGHLPGKKVWPWVARNRYSTPGVQLISPPPHHDIYSIEDLAQLIHDLKSANREARINVKLVSEAGVGTIAVGVAKGLADTITISGFDGGTGAAARTSIRHAGLPWELGVAEAHSALVASGLRERVRIETDGKLFTGRDIVIAAMLGAEEFTFATGPLIAMGCDMMRVCNKDTCPVGIATQNPKLRQCFVGRPQNIENFMRFVARSARELMARIGVRSFDELIGRSDLLSLRPSVLESTDPSLQLDFEHFLHPAGQIHNSQLQQHDFANLFEGIGPSRPSHQSFAINNRERTLGTILSSRVDHENGSAGLAEQSIVLDLEGSAGQSFGAYLAPGISLNVSGDANDYLGKGLSGGRISLRPPAASPFVAADNIICGNVALYGATAGQAYLAGIAGERFCVRNSGATAVVEGVGDHGCEYMTGGRVLIIGPTGRNFAAGMSGGIAYVWDHKGNFADHCNLAGVSLSALDDDDRAYVHGLLQQHLAATGSERARGLLKAEHFADFADQVVKVVPDAYQKVLDALTAAQGENLSEEQSMIRAYEAVQGVA